MYYAGHTGLQALHAAEGALHFSIMLPPCKAFALEAADAWSGNVLVFKQCADCSEAVRGEAVSSHPHSSSVHHLRGSLQFARLAGFLR